MTCAACGTVFDGRRKDQRFCSATCRLTTWHDKRDREQAEHDARVRLTLRAAQQARTLRQAQQAIAEALALLDHVHGQTNRRRMTV